MKKLLLLAPVSALAACSGVEKSTQDLPSQTPTERMQSVESQETKMFEKADSGSTGGANKEISKSDFLGAMDILKSRYEPVSDAHVFENKTYTDKTDDTWLLPILHLTDDDQFVIVRVVSLRENGDVAGIRGLQISTSDLMIEVTFQADQITLDEDYFDTFEFVEHRLTTANLATIGSMIAKPEMQWVVSTEEGAVTHDVGPLEKSRVAEVLRAWQGLQLGYDLPTMTG